MYHLSFAAKYRKGLLGKYGQEAKSILERIATQSEFSIWEMEVDQDPIHRMVPSVPELSPAQIVRRLQAESSRHSYRALIQNFARISGSARRFGGTGTSA